MNIGDYVRTKNGIIGKIKTKNLIGYDDWIIDTLYYNDDEIIDDWTCGIKEYNVIKSSPNIIDLIEVGDYVNGERVFGFGKFIYDDDTEEICSLTLETTISCLPEDIKSILTHEQFESMEYKL